MYLQLKSWPAFSKSGMENDKTNNTRAFYIKIHPLRVLKVDASTVLNLKPCYGNVNDTYSGQKKDEYNWKSHHYLFTRISFMFMLFLSVKNNTVLSSINNYTGTNELLNIVM